MATKVELPKDIVHRALTQNIGSLTRAAKGASNPIIKDALEKELAAVQTAANTLTEIK